MRGAILSILAGTALALASTAANAGTVTIGAGSQMSIGGNAQLNGPTPTSTASQATSIDFLVMPGAVAGAAPGSVTNYLGTGTFAGESCAGNTCGLINDIASVAVGASTTPLFTLMDGVTFSLTNITSIDRSVSNVLTFQGTGSFGGTLNGAGNTIVSTPGSFVFSTQGGTLTSFSATAVAVPEPATWALMLLGFGGIGMAMRRRRRPALAQIA
jgi:hypothetical protein